MKHIQALGLGAALFLSSAPVHAGPCTPQIAAMQGKIDARLDSAAMAGKSGPESTAATDHRQPTPKSIAEAEVKLGDISGQTAQTLEGAMARARKADLAGDKAACEKALSEAQDAMGK